MSGGDRRPWLIISRREASALYGALAARVDERSEVGRALRQIRNQLSWLERQHADTIAEALEREYQHW